MRREPKTPNRFAETPRDKLVTERTEHANLDRPGARAHPVARGWLRPDPNMAWRMR